MERTNGPNRAPVAELFDAQLEGLDHRIGE